MDGAGINGFKSFILKRFKEDSDELHWKYVYFHKLDIRLPEHSIVDGIVIV